MDTYILQKDLPYFKSGIRYLKNETDARVDRNSYFPDVVGSKNERFAIHADYVENNPDWFKLENNSLIEQKTINGIFYGFNKKVYDSIFYNLIIYKNDKDETIVQLINKDKFYTLPILFNPCIELINSRSEKFIELLLNAGSTINELIRQ